MKAIRKITMLLLAVVLVMGMVTSVSAEEISGECGANVTWSLDAEGTLTISGSGRMRSYSHWIEIPWISYRGDIRKVVIESGVVNIANGVFAGCKEVSEFYIPDTLISMAATDFNDCRSLTGIYIDENNPVYSNDAQGILYDKTQTTLLRAPAGLSGHCVIPNTVTNIGDDAFSFCQSLTEITIPASVTSIGKSAFSYCINLTEIELPNSVNSIGENAFQHCEALAEFSIPNEIGSIEDGTFSSCQKLKKIIIPASVSSIGESAFSYCKSLTEIAIPASVNSIGARAFSYCTNLTYIILPEGITTIEHRTFFECGSLSAITIPQSITQKIHGDYAFYGCVSLSTVFYRGHLNVSISSPYATEQHFHVTDVFVNGQPAFQCSSCGNCYSYDGTRLFGEPDVGPSEPEHVHDYTSEETKYPSCDAVGYNTYICSCGDSYVEETPALGHAFIDGVCTRCGAEDPDYEEPVESVENPFSDVEERDYFYDPVLWAVECGITAGTGHGKFSPDDPCTRAQVVTFLWRAAGKPAPASAENPFTDVESDDYFYDAVLWAVGEGITAGTSATTFDPDKVCTRAQVATFLWRTADKPEPVSTACPFNDVAERQYYYDPVLWAVENQITSGTSQGKFSPDDPCTRGQIVTFLYRFMTR